MSGMRILVADSNQKFLVKARKFLAHAGYEVVTARTAEEARNVVTEREFDAVVASAELPGGTGFELCRAVKVDRDPTVPCVVLVPNESNEIRNATAECGAENFLVQPVKERDLLFVLRDLATIRHLKRRLVESRGENRSDSVFDPLTGFHNFTHFKEVLFIEVKRARRYGYPISMILCAYDPGRGVSEGQDGHELRKRLYGGLAVAVRKCMRDYDIVVAYLEKQVLVLMPHTDLKGAAVVGKRIRESIAASAFKIDGRTFRPTVSVGVAGSESARSDSFSEMVREAKRALDSSARAGGNAVVQS